MFVKPNPPGVNKPLECDRMHIVKVISGDAWKIDTRLVNPSNGMPASYMNTRVRFVLSENKFNKMPLWVGEWSKGVYEDTVIPGLVHVVVPEKVSSELRRGTYAYSIVVTDIDGCNRKTELSGYFEVEYEPSSAEHDIPYRDDETGSKALDKYVEKMDDDRALELQKVLDEIWTGDGSVKNMEEGVRIIAEYLIGEKKEDPDDPDDPSGDDQEDIEKTLVSIADSVDQLVDVVKDAVKRRKPCPCPPPPPCRPHRPPCVPHRPYGCPSWYEYPDQWNKENS